MTRITKHPLYREKNAARIVKKVMLREAMTLVTLHDGMYLEFGVQGGASINYISRLKKDKTIYGFDCWTGLPDDWLCLGNIIPKGSYTNDGNVPVNIEDNVVLVSGLFEDSFPNFIKNLASPTTAFVHIDCDLYSSTKTIFEHFGHTFVSGTIIVFDEYMEDAGEKQAFDEWLEESGMYASLVQNTIYEQAFFIIHDNKRSFRKDRITWGPDDVWSGPEHGPKFTPDMI